MKARRPVLVVRLLALSCVLGAACSSPPRAVSASGAPRAIGPYSQAIDTGDLVFVSGQIPIDPATQEIVPGDIEAQAERVLGNLQAVLAGAGLGLDDIVRTTVYMTDLSEFSRMNAVYARFFSKRPPARATVQVAALPKGAKIEIDAIARR